MISFDAMSASSFHTPRCSPGRYRCVGSVPQRSLRVIFRPYISTTSPAGVMIGITSDPLKCSWPLSRKMPSRSSRPRISAPAARFFAVNAVAQRPIREARVGSGRSSPPTSSRALQVLHRLRRLRTTSAVEVHHAQHQTPGRPRLRRHRRRAASAPCSFSPTGSARRRREVAFQQLHRMRKLTPSARITHSITSPPSPHAPMQCHTFFAGSMIRHGLRSSWNGHLPISSLPAAPQLDAPRLGQPLHRYFSL